MNPFSFLACTRITPAAYYAPLFAVLLIGCSPKSSERTAPIQEMWTMNVDFADQNVYAANYGVTEWSREEIAKMFAFFQNLGIQRMFWRVSVSGLVSYPSKVRTVYPGPFPPSEKGKRLAALLQHTDPLKVAIEEAKKAGIQIYVWITLFDEFGTDADGKFASDFIRKHPEYQWTAKDGETVFKGVLSYSFAEVRTHRLAEIAEVLERNPDGVFLCTRTHSFYWGADQGDDFGYEEPVREEFLKRHGANIRTSTDFDKEAWRNLRAEGLDKFIRDASRLVRSTGKKLAVGIPRLGTEEMGWPYGSAVIPWHQWVRDKVIDELVIGRYFQDMTPLPAAHAALLALPGGDAVRTTFWVQLYNYQQNKETSPQALESIISAVRGAGINGGTFHQSDNLLDKKPSNLALRKVLQTTLTNKPL